MGYKVDNAIIMAAGTSSRFAPLSFEKPKALIEVRGEILIERQIKQLQEAGIPEIIVVVGYGKEQFLYLKDKFHVAIVENNDYLTRNNNASIFAAKDHLRNTYICSSDNYFEKNPFEREVDDSYYAGVYADSETNEWCMTEDSEGYIDSVQIGGSDAWYMLGHAFWNEEFSRKFVEILENVYDLPETINALWESIFMAHLAELKMKIRKYPKNMIFEFDTLDELRAFDSAYINDTRSSILKSIAKELQCTESEITEVYAYKDSNNAAAGFHFKVKGLKYEYNYENQKMRRI